MFGKTQKLKLPLMEKARKSTKYLMVFLLLVISGFIAYSFLSGPGGITAWVVSFSEEEEPFSVNANVSISDFSIKSDNLIISISPERGIGSLLVDELRFDSESPEIRFLGYKGTVSVGIDGLLNLDGKADSMLVNGVSIDKDKRLKVEASSLGFKSVTLMDLDMNSLEFAASGEIDSAGKGLFELNGDDVEIESFKGDIGISGSYFSIGGETTKITIDSVPKIVIG